MAERSPQPVHETDHSSPAPGELEQVRRFLSLHDHEPGTPASLEPALSTIAWWLRSSGLLDTDETLADDDLRWAEQVRRALATKVSENMGNGRDLEAIELLNKTAAESGVQLCFGCGDDSRLHVRAEGLRGAIGRMLGIAFLAELDGSWHRLRSCAEPTCLSVFYDRSRNHTAKWCSMQTCGNRNKVRQFRQRSKGTSTA